MVRVARILFMSGLLITLPSIGIAKHSAAANRAVTPYSRCMGLNLTAAMTRYAAMAIVIIENRIHTVIEI